MKKKLKTLQLVDPAIKGMSVTVSEKEKYEYSLVGSLMKDERYKGFYYVMDLN